MMYIYKRKDWPNFILNNDEFIRLLGKVRNSQGKLFGKVGALGFDLQEEAQLETLTLDVIKSTEIEGIILNPEQVRSSVAQRLGIDISGLPVSDRNVDGVVDMMFDATNEFSKPLTKDRLFGWHCALFPTGRSGMRKIIAGYWRDDSNGPMQVVSGTTGKEKIHYEALAAETIEPEMEVFLNWFNSEQETDFVIKAAIAHLYILSIHPFEDGNGRIARALTDMLLARSDKNPQRFYSMSAQIQKNRKGYYDILERTQKSDLDITDWVIWFLDCLLKAINESENILSKIIFKHRFWSKNAIKLQNERQKLILGKLLDSFYGNLTSSKWAKMTKCSQDTALRDIQDLIQKGILRKTARGGRSTNYELIEKCPVNSG